MGNGEISQSWKELSRSYGDSSFSSVKKYVDGKAELLSSISELVYRGFSEIYGKNTTDTKYVFIVDLIIERVSALIDEKLANFITSNEIDEFKNEIIIEIQKLSEFNNYNVISDIEIPNNVIFEISNKIVEKIHQYYNKSTSSLLENLNILFNELNNNEQQTEVVESNPIVDEQNENEKVDGEQSFIDTLEKKVDELKEKLDINIEDTKEKTATDEDEENEKEVKKEETDKNDKDDKNDIVDKAKSAISAASSIVRVVLYTTSFALEFVQYVKLTNCNDKVLNHINKKFGNVYNNIYKAIDKYNKRPKNTKQSKEQEKIKIRIDAVIAAFRKMVENLVNFINQSDYKNVLNSAIDNFIKMFKKIMDAAFKGLLAAFKALLIGVGWIPLLVVLGIAILGLVSGKIRALLDAVLIPIANIVEKVCGTIQNLLQTKVKPLVETILNGLGAVLRPVLDFINVIVAPILRFLKPVIVLFIRITLIVQKYVLKGLVILMNVIASCAEPLGRWLVGAGIALFKLLNWYYGGQILSTVKLVGEIIAWITLVILDFLILFCKSIKPFAQVLGEVLVTVGIITWNLLALFCKFLEPVAFILGAIIASIIIPMSYSIKFICWIISGPINLITSIIKLLNLFFKPLEYVAYFVGKAIAFIALYQIKWYKMLYLGIKAIAREVGYALSKFIEEDLGFLYKLIIAMKDKLGIKTDDRPSEGIEEYKRKNELFQKMFNDHVLNLHEKLRNYYLGVNSNVVMRVNKEHTTRYLFNLKYQKLMELVNKWCFVLFGTNNFGYGKIAWGTGWVVDKKIANAAVTGMHKTLQELLDLLKRTDFFYIYIKRDIDRRLIRILEKLQIEHEKAQAEARKIVIEISNKNLEMIDSLQNPNFNFDSLESEEDKKEVEDFVETMFEYWKTMIEYDNKERELKKSSSENIISILSTPNMLPFVVM